MMERRPIKSAPTTDLATVSSTNGSGAEITIDSPLPIRLAELERRISAALTDERTAHDLANLLMQIDLAIPAAEEFAKGELERALDPLQSPDPREARQQAEDATFAANRLRTLRPRLLVRYQQVSAAEQRQQYLSQYTTLESQGRDLAQELADLYPGLVGPLIDLFVRLRAFQQKRSALHQTDPGGLPHVPDPELKARGLDGFTRDTPSLLESVRLSDWRSGKEIWPPHSTFAADFVQSMGVPQHPGAAWSDPEFLSARRRAIVDEQERIARFAAEAEREQTERMNREEREAFALQMAARRNGG